MPILFDPSTEPLVRVQYLETFSDKEFDQHLSAYSALLDAGKKYGIVIDAMRASVPSPRQRAMQAEWMRNHADVLSRLCVGGAFAIGSPVIRGALTAILWLQPVPFSYKVLETTSAAESWVRSKLAEAGVLPR